MKKGFTMIELIFVIVILGILAAVAIPRLAATRDDAEITKTISNATMAIRDFTSYYTAQGDFNSTAANMTNVQLIDSTGKVQEPDTNTAKLTNDTTAVWVPFKGEKCIKVTFIASESALLVAKDGPASGSAKAACDAVAGAPGVKSLIDSKYTKSDGNSADGVKVGGTSGIKF